MRQVKIAHRKYAYARHEQIVTDSVSSGAKKKNTSGT